MFDQALGLLLFFLGFNKTLPLVKGDATPSASLSTQSAILKKRDAIQTERKAFLETRLKKQKEAIAALKSKNEQLKEKLATIKDERKRTIVTNLQENFQKVNENRTNALTNHLTVMSDILKKLAERGSVSGKDTTSLTTFIGIAQTAINEAMSAVTTQAGKTYSITVTSGEEGLKSDVKKVRETLGADLKSAHEKVKVAREAVGNAIRELGKLQGENIPTPTTTTATP